MNFDLPARMNGELLGNELAAAGIDADGMLVRSGRLVLPAVVSESDRATAEQVVADHVPPAPAGPEPTAQDVLDAIRELADEGAEAEQRIHERANAKAKERAQA